MTRAAAPAPALAPAQVDVIAHAFRPERALGNRFDYHYVRAKLRSDPLYPGVVAALVGTSAPLLDLGCGLGLLAHALRAQGVRLPYRGVDNDAGKIARAQRAAARAGLDAVDFACVDLARDDPTHRGSVALLDVLQFLPVDAQDHALDAALGMLVPGAKLVLRTGLADGSGRARITRAVDVFSRLAGWMQAGPTRYPDAERLRARFAAAGLQAEFTPLYGRTPFNNWRIVVSA